MLLTWSTEWMGVPMFRVMEDAGGAAACARNLVEVGARMWIRVDPVYLPGHGVPRSKFPEDCA